MQMKENIDFIYEIPKIRVKILVKAVVLGVFLHAERKSNLRCFLVGSKFHLWGNSAMMDV